MTSGNWPNGPMTYGFSEVHPQLQLERALRRRPVSRRCSLERDVSERVCVIEVHLRAAINGRNGERSSIRARRWVIEDVSRIHADGACEALANFETLGYSHVRRPGSRSFNRVQPDI